MPEVAGIMGHSVGALSLILKSLLSTEPWLHDPLVMPVPWREVSESSVVAFGFMKDDGLVTPHPPIARALEIVEAALRESGHEVSMLVFSYSKVTDNLQLFKWDPPSNNRSMEIHVSI